jgi:WD40 repeat protein
MVDELVELRQKSITEFLLNGGKTQRIASYFNNNFQRNPAIYSHPLFLMCKRKYKNNPIHDVTSKICLSKFGFSKLEFTKSAKQSNNAHITCIKFDSIGVLFAVCSSSGIIQIYDFDESNAKLNKRYVSILQ